ncbi:MAG: response regulator, partial [Steroidobacteraceae bacterium]|nr:response regulator [Steroidobacteraceae bacterium]
MAAKRALIVDDSKSARTFLACILEKYELTVDMAENAEQALEYLQTAKPDVIFMDHLMPGMDGFQALQSIKNDPRTAMIPILMYTSQEGELYLGQARALGAIGVLPKQIKPADVSRVLYQLRILPDRRNADVQTTFTRADAAAQAAAIRQAVREAGDTPHLRVVSSKPGGTSTADLRDLVESVVQQHLVDLHRSVTASLDAQSERLLGDVRIAVQEGIAEANREAASAEQARAKRGAPLRRAVAAAGVAALLAAVGFTLWWREALHRRGIAEELRVARQEAAALTARLT